MSNNLEKSGPAPGLGNSVALGLAFGLVVLTAIDPSKYFNDSETGDQNKLIHPEINPRTEALRTENQYLDNDIDALDNQIHALWQVLKTAQIETHDLALSCFEDNADCEATPINILDSNAALNCETDTSFHCHLDCETYQLDQHVFHRRAIFQCRNQLQNCLSEL